jgi:hypothetical protein
MASQWSIIVANYQERFTKLRHYLAATCAMFTVAFVPGVVILQLWPTIALKTFRQCDEQCQRIERIDEANAIGKQADECVLLAKSGAIRELTAKCANLPARLNALRSKSQDAQR